MLCEARPVTIGASLSYEDYYVRSGNIRRSILRMDRYPSPRMQTQSFDVQATTGN